MKQIDIGIIGVGRMGHSHCRVFSQLRDVHLVGICDQDHELGRRIAAKYEVPFFSDAQTLIDAAAAVSIVTPTPSHFELAQATLQRGRHLFVEKPVTKTVDQAKNLVSMAKDSGLVAQVGHIERFNPVFSELKNVIDEMGVVAVNLRRLSAYAGSNTDVDVVLDLMVHDLDLALDLGRGDPVRVDAQGITAFSGAIDHAVVNLQFAMGPLMTLTASRLTEHKVRSIELTALDGYVEADLLNKSIAVHRRTFGEYQYHNNRAVRYRQESMIERIHVPMAEPLTLELQHFIDCVRQETTPIVTLEQGERVLALAHQIREAIQRKMLTVRMPLAVEPAMASAV